MYNCYTPQETAEIVSRAGVVKGNQRLDKIFFSAVSAGCLLSFACATALSTNAAPWFQENAPGLIRTISAFVFPYGLCTIVLTGAELCTGSFMFTAMAVYHRRLSVVKMLIHWTVTFWGNLAGSLFMVAIITGYGGTFDSAGYMKEVLSFAKTKQVTPEWHQVFLRGIGANWLVCLACYLGMSGREYFSKIMGIWWPTFAFVSLGFDHVVANMFFIPIAIWHGAPDISVGLYIWKGIIPALLGNIVGGALFVGAYYYYQFLHGQEAPVIDGIPYGGAGGGMVELGRKPHGDEETLRGHSPRARGKKEDEELGS
ncbi:hypothetical protein LTR99_010650 [Exophiala xenobiotica]|uniref:Formate/nitrite transporter n=1 Tax=Vermiconidia calcicola TaxID=1690605 RepID=A0AAV9Q1F9_9PEZI|nr:hypothetical protein LTR92_007275 [Exophiala xenobiotica]KAK5533860.1 hypothetical protein LTR25_006840 [Vermiconidia calcicola]KAK5546411.1 hypothetical protein LTR23_003516 [Chaetothyriales sp. CCFEE 6169]KAK5272246.1 hypothetical protein LTR96_001876 [Exophiala xenobiotica]KAK5291797.1 hypothetical protein LTR99_010650 [Exophiala xenobiotica]